MLRKVSVLLVVMIALNANSALSPDLSLSSASFLQLAQTAANGAYGQFNASPDALRVAQLSQCKITCLSQYDTCTSGCPSGVDTSPIERKNCVDGCGRGRDACLSRR